MIHDEHRQRRHRVRVEWGPVGVAVLAAECAAVVVVDVLSFSTAVDVATRRGALVLPQATGDPGEAAREAAAVGAVAAGPRHGSGPSLRPSSLLGLAAGTRIGLASPNGGTLCALAAAAGAVLFAGCLRNASAVAAAAEAVGGPVGVVPAGERWPDGTLRPAVEDAIGAGAIVAALCGDRSPEAGLAEGQYHLARDRGLHEVLSGCASGRELVSDGYGADVDLAAALEVSTGAPRLRDGLFAA
ncbi:MAG TPA: 2-phosphosulfolactate phosphatase [Pseudonocardia sp.]|nr:2-phosphosulfolactate phosphatase [Pseudonocardia sp.]